jgi:hypothetical protein
MSLEALAKQTPRIRKGAMPNNLVRSGQGKQDSVPVGLRTIRADNPAKDTEQEICGGTLQIKDGTFGIANESSMVAGLFRDFARKAPFNQRSLDPFSVLFGHGESVHQFSPPELIFRSSPPPPPFVWPPLWAFAPETR